MGLQVRLVKACMLCHAVRVSRSPGPQWALNDSKARKKASSYLPEGLSSLDRDIGACVRSSIEDLSTL